MLRTTVSCLSVLACGVVGLGILAPPAAAVPAPGSLYCTYKLHQRHHSVDGKCSGQTEFGSASGSFQGSVRPNGTAKGTFELDSTLGSYDGTFNGSGFDGGTATGSFTVKLGPAQAKGNFRAWIG